MKLSDSFLNNRKLENHVENQTTYSLNNAEMHIFETHLQAEKVLLRFDKPVLATMIQGKKVMHLDDMNSFDFLPGESLILPSNELMCIDFPEAQLQDPTRCLAMSINEDKLMNIISFLNETMPKADGKEWTFTDYNFHFTNDTAIHQIIHRLLFLFTENHPSKDVFADFMLQELIIRILQAETRKVYEEKSTELSSDNRIAFIVKYIREHLHESLTVDSLSGKLHMSESNFYRVFKNEMGISPIDYINSERLKLACSLLNDSNKQIKEISSACGFNSESYFTRLFKRVYNMTPGQYQKKLQRVDAYYN